MEEYVYLNGSIVPAREARISVFDAGFMHAAGLFETLRAYNGRVMRLEDHLDRLNHSAARLDLHAPIDKASIARGIEQLLDINKLTDARLRLVTTPGNVPRPGQEPSADQPATTLITAAQVQPYPSELYEQGMRVCIAPYKQSRLDPLAGHKTLAYLPRLLAIKEAAERRCNEALWFTTENQLAEGSVANVFIITAGAIATPPLKTPVLPGTVRKAVIELAEEHEIPFEERAIAIDALLAADEVFLTGSILEIMPVTAIEKHVVGDGNPGEITQRLRRLYSARVAEECGIDG